MSLIEEARRAKEEGETPIQCNAIYEALQTDAYGALIVACEVWEVDTSKHKGKMRKK